MHPSSSSVSMGGCSITPYHIQKASFPPSMWVLELGDLVAVGWGSALLCRSRLTVLSFSLQLPYPVCLFQFLSTPSRYLIR
jgi:hypothetical protein